MAKAQIILGELGGAKRNSDVLANMVGASCMFIDSEGNYIPMTSSGISSSGTYISVSGATNNLTITAIKKCHVHGYYITAGQSTYNVIDSDFSVGQTILSGSNYVVLEAY